MRKGTWILVLTMAILLSVYAQEDIPFKMYTIGGEWAVGVDLSGIVRIEEYTIDIDVESVKFVVPQDYKFDQTIESISLGLSKHPRKRSKSWATYENSNVIKLDKLMKPGEEYELKNITFQIPIHDFYDIEEKWLTLQIESLVIEKKGKKTTPGYVYAHSEEDIFH